MNEYDFTGFDEFFEKCTSIDELINCYGYLKNNLEKTFKQHLAEISNKREV